MKLPFDTILVINLQRRPDKYERIMSRIKELGLDKYAKVIRVDAIDGTAIDYDWLKENEPIEYSEWLEKFSEIHNLDKIIKKPCDFDHNGECLICDCWPSDCAYKRYLNGDYKWESKEELENMFKDFVYIK